MKKLLALSGILVLGLAFLLGGAGFSQGDVAKVGFIYIGPTTDGGWTASHDNGRKAIEASFGDRVQTVFVENVLEGDFEAEARRMVLQENIDILFATSATYQEFIIDLADEFPNVKFEFTDPTVVEPKDNIRGYYVRYYEGNYVCGFGMGRLLNAKGIDLSGKILGEVSSLKFPLTVRNTNAWVQGVRDGLGFDIPAKVLWLISQSENPWFNPPVANAFANALVDDGAIGLNTFLDDPGIISVGEERDALSAGITADLREFGPSTNVCNSVVKWDDYYIGQVQKIIDGNWESGFTWARVLSVPLVDISPSIGEFVDEVVVQEMLSLQQRIAAGKFRVLPQFSEETLLTSVEFLPGITD